MKKFLTLLLALVMALSIVGCGKTNTDEPQTPDTPDDGADEEHHGDGLSPS